MLVRYLKEMCTGMSVWLQEVVFTEMAKCRDDDAYALWKRNVLNGMIANSDYANIAGIFEDKMQKSS